MICFVHIVEDTFSDGAEDDEPAEEALESTIVRPWAPVTTGSKTRSSSPGYDPVLRSLL